MIRMWRLSEGGEDNLGLACTNDGLVLGRTPLIERRDHRFVVRDQGEIEALLSRAYRKNIAADRLMSGLATVATALNANDSCLARIAAVHLRIPDLPDRSARNGLEAQDFLIRCANADPRDIHKASPDDPKHPGWPAGTPGGSVENSVQRTARESQSRRRSKTVSTGRSCGSVLSRPCTSALRRWPI